MGFFVLTNNPLVLEAVEAEAPVVFWEGGMKGVLEEAARYVGCGHRLLTHPLSGSVKPGETPYKSLLLSSDAGQGMDASSAKLVSNAIEACGTFVDKSGCYDERVKGDLQVVDLSLIRGALDSICT